MPRNVSPKMRRRLPHFDDFLSGLGSPGLRIQTAGDCTIAGTKRGQCWQCKADLGTMQSQCVFDRSSELRRTSYASPLQPQRRCNVVFRTLKTGNVDDAEASFARLKDNLRRAELGHLLVPEGADVAAYLLSDGRALAKPTLPCRLGNPEETSDFATWRAN